MSFTAIPYEDIITLLSSNNIIIPATKSEAYTIAYDLLSSDKEMDNIPDTITDWINAYNIGKSGIPIAKYTTSQIITSSDTDLEQLYHTFSLNYPDKERIIRMLDYLQLLTNDLISLEMLPHDALDLILTELECKDMLLMCKLSTNINKYCKTSRFLKILNNKLGTSEASFEKLSSMCLETDLRTRHNVFVQIKYKDKKRSYVLGADNTIYRVSKDKFYDAIPLLTGNVLEIQGITRGNKTNSTLEDGLIVVTKDYRIYEIELHSHKSKMKLIDTVKNIIFTRVNGHLFAAVTSTNHILLHRTVNLGSYETTFGKSMTKTQLLHFPKVGNIVDLKITLKRLFLVNSAGKIWYLTSIQSPPVMISGLNNIIKIMTGLGEERCIGLDNKGIMYAWNFSRQSDGIQQLELPYLSGLGTRIIDANLAFNNLILLFDTNVAINLGIYVRLVGGVKSEYTVDDEDLKIVKDAVLIQNDGAIISKDGSIFYRGKTYKLLPKFIKYT